MNDEAHYGSASFPAPRAFQDRAHQQLRDGVRAGHRCQMLMAPTGGGKTYLGLRIIHEALQRNKRCIFVADRTTLIDQTSANGPRPT
jgi:DNA repair protein RadD